MKKKIVLSMMSFVVGITVLMAQGPGNGPRATIEERIKTINEKLADLKLNNDNLAKTDSVFKNYFTAMQKQRDDMRAAGGTPDRDAMREKMLKLNIDRDEQLKQIFTDDQFKKWKNDIEPALRPQRPAGQQ